MMGKSGQNVGGQGFPPGLGFGGTFPGMSGQIRTYGHPMHDMREKHMGRIYCLLTVYNTLDNHWGPGHVPYTIFKLLSKCYILLRVNVSWAPTVVSALQYHYTARVTICPDLPGHARKWTPKSKSGGKSLPPPHVLSGFSHHPQPKGSSTLIGINKNAYISVIFKGKGMKLGRIIVLRKHFNRAKFGEDSFMRWFLRIFLKMCFLKIYMQKRHF